MLLAHQYLLGVAILNIEFRGMLLRLRQSIDHVSVKLRIIACGWLGHVGSCQYILIIGFSYQPVVLELIVLEKDVRFIELSLSEHHFETASVIVNIFYLNRIVAQRGRNVDGVRLAWKGWDNSKVDSMAEVMGRVYYFCLVTAFWLADVQADHHGLGCFESGFSQNLLFQFIFSLLFLLFFLG